ncbi:MAG: nitroreductase family protein [Candidatus Thorarchaeota archaeon]|nr:MAG: nitroreductase family protein [Candidatus Thorarchaeota archaeon]
MEDNETIKTIKERRAIRDYDTERDVSDELIHRIIEAGTYAPSAENQQPWRIIVVRDKEVQEFIGQIAVDRTVLLFGRATPREELERRLGYIRSKVSLERTIDILISGERFEYIKGKKETFGAPVLLVLAIDQTHVGNSQETLRGTGGVYGWSSPRHGVIAGSMMMQNMTLAAASLGLGSCVSSVQLDHFDDVGEISKRLGIPFPHWTPILCLTVGYAKHERTLGPPRQAPEEVTFLNQWGEPFSPKEGGK